VKKMGIVFVWGKDRVPWNADYLRLKDVPASEGGSDVIDVTGQDFRGVIDRLGYLETPVTAFNVERAEFDDMLLKQARKFGAEVREGTRATDVLRDASGRVEGVRWQDDTGRTGTISTPFVLDASGLQTMLSRGERVYDPDMNNFAVYGYLQDAEWKVRFSGSKDRSTVFIAAVDLGWIWYIPIRQNVMSVGAVTRKDHFKDRLKDLDLESFWWEMLHSCPEVADLIKNATLRTDILPHGKRVAATQDWSSWAASPVGHGWAAAGDAAMFVDPILSSGVTLAVQSGHRAAYTYLTARARPELDEATLWQAYASYVRGEYGAFLQMARYWYGNNQAAPSWWWEAQQVVNKAGRLRLDDHQAFTMATAGFFPIPRALTTEVVGSLISHLSGAKADILGAVRDSGVPEADELLHCHLETLTPFRLGVRTEPPAEGAPAQLQVFHDLIPENPDFAHRTAAAPHRIAPALAPVVSAIPRHTRVATLVDEAPSLLPPGFAAPETIRSSTLHLVKIAAMKGFVRVNAGEGVVE
jgi:clorobiocin biosynthesis protein Clo-hal